MGNNSSSGERFPHVAIRESEISTGDHLYSSRGGIFDHHGIYIGKDRVIHFLKSVDDLSFGSGSSSGGSGRPCVCGHHRRKSGVVKSCLDCFLRGGKIYRYEYGYPAPYAGLKTGQAGLMKWSTSFPSDPPETVVARAKQLLSDGFGEYNFTENNCEDFALFCKTGERIRSGQVVLSSVVSKMIIACVLFPFAFAADFDWEECRIDD